MNESPFAHRIARKPKTITPVESKTTPVVIGHIPLSQDDFAHEEEVTPTVAKAAPAPAPVAAKAAPAESSALRQCVVAVIAFIVTVCVIAVAAIAFKAIFTSK